MPRKVHFWPRTRHRCYQMSLAVGHPILKDLFGEVKSQFGRSEVSHTSVRLMCRSCRLSVRRSRFVTRIDNARSPAVGRPHSVWIQDLGLAWTTTLVVLVVGRMLRDVVVGSIELEEPSAFDLLPCRPV